MWSWVSSKYGGKTLSDQTKDQVEISSPEEYLDYVIEATKRMLGVLQLEVQMSSQQGTMSKWDQLHFEIAGQVLTELQLLAMSKQEEMSKPDIAVPDTSLVDPNGKPLAAA